MAEGRSWEKYATETPGLVPEEGLVRVMALYREYEANWRPARRRNHALILNIGAWDASFELQVLTSYDSEIVKVVAVKTTLKMKQVRDRAK